MDVLLLIYECIFPSDFEEIGRKLLYNEFHKISVILVKDFFPPPITTRYLTRIFVDVSVLNDHQNILFVSWKFVPENRWCCLSYKSKH